MSFPRAKAGLVHRGHIAVAGFYYEHRDEAFARSDIVTRYEAGTQVFRHQGQLLVLFPRGQRIAVNECVATPLVKQGQGLTALPLLEGLAPSPELEVILAHAGRLQLAEILRDHEEDPATWLVLERYTFESGHSLQPPPPPVEMAISTGSRDIKKLLGGVIGEAPPEHAKLQQALLVSDSQARSSARLGGGIAQAIFTFADMLGSLLGISGSAARQLPGKVGKATISERRPGKTSSSLWERAARGLKSFIWRSELGRWLGREHAKYLGNLFELLEGGSYEEALRRAIPAHNRGTGGDDVQLRPFGRRDELRLGEASGGGGTLGLGDDLYAQLRAAYRRAFNELKRQERHHEAAFVLSELLQENEEAVSYLEANGLIAQAAELAEARDLSAGLIVRLWFRAGQRERAIAIARRDGAFEDALARLKEFPEDAKALRLLWAEHLADAGNYAGAVEVVKELSEATSLRERWMDLAIEQGGAAGARALVTMCRFQSDRFGHFREEALKLLGNQDRFDSAALEEMGNLLISSLSPLRAERALARCLIRALLRDRGLGLNAVSHTTIRRLAQICEDGALVADLPDVPVIAELPRLRNRVPPLRVEPGRNDIGRTRILDAALSSKGRYLVAKGDAGVFLYSKSQELLHHFDVPADRIVVSDNGDRILAVAPRGEISTVAQIDLTTRRARHFRNLELSQFASTFDGSTWYVAKGSFVHALDLQSKTEQSLWRSGDAGTGILAIARDATHLSFSTIESECWSHQLSPHRLRNRTHCQGTPVLGGTSCDFYLGFAEREAVAEASTVAEENPDRITPLSRFGLFETAGKRSLELGAASVLTKPRVEDANRDWIIVSYRTSITDQVLVVVDRAVLLVRLEIVLHNSHSVTARLGQQVLLVADQSGRVLGFELGSGAQVLNHRI